MIVSAMITFVCVCLMYVLLCRHYFPTGNKLVPTHPGKLPIIGHMLSLNIKDIYQTIISLGQFSLDAGGVSKVFIGPMPIYIVSDPEDMATVLNKCLDKMFLYRFIEPMVGKMLVAADVPVWKRNRKILDLGFKQQILDDYLELFSNQAKCLVEALDEEVGKGEVDLTEKITRSVLETTCRTTLGMGVDGKDLVNDQYVAAINDFLEIMVTRLFKPWLMFDFIFNLSTYKRRSSKAFEIIFGLSEQMVRLRKTEHLKRLQNTQDFNDEGGKFRSLLDILIANTVTETSSLFTDNELRNIVDNVLLAAFDTTIYELLFLLICIGSYPDVQEKILEEVNHVIDEDGILTKENLSQLVYLDAVIKESVRVYPIGPLVGRQAMADTKLRSMIIPAGSSIAVHLLAVNKNPKYWGSDAEEFIPERWLNSITLPEHPAAYASFAPGRRGCIGKTYAIMYLKATVVPIIRKYKLTADYRKMKLDCKIMIKPISGHHVKIELRK